MTRPGDEQRLAARVPPAGERPVMYQRWSDLLFLHWDWPPEDLASRLPEGLHLDLHEDRAYLGIVPFFMSGIRPRGLPAVPWLSRFQELNVRTYVHDDAGVPGVWFFTLDAANPVAVALARSLFHLPYRHARMGSSGEGVIDYRSQARGGRETRFRYPRPEGGEEAPAGSLPFFLFERYFLYAHHGRRNRLYRGQVAHRPYRFRETTVECWDTIPLQECGFADPDRPPAHTAVAPGFPVHIHPLRRVA